MNTFVDKLIKEILDKETLLCLGLDPQIKFFPKFIFKEAYRQARDKQDLFEIVARAIVIFNEYVIKVCIPYIAVAKPQMAFYEKYGAWGVWAFQETIKLLKKYGILAIEDGKRSDGGATADAYAEGHLGEVDLWDPNTEQIIRLPSINVDALTVMPAIDQACLSSFLKVCLEFGKGIFVVTKTSFKPNSRIENLRTLWRGRKVWQVTAGFVKKWGMQCLGENGYSNIGVVAGATFPIEAKIMRKILGDLFIILGPGYGYPQAAAADSAVKGINSKGLGLITNSSRGINYAYLRDPFKCEPEKFYIASGKMAEFSRDDLNSAVRRLNLIPW